MQNKLLNAEKVIPSITAAMNRECVNWKKEYQEYKFLRGKFNSTDQHQVGRFGMQLKGESIFIAHSKFLKSDIDMLDIWQFLCDSVYTLHNRHYFSTYNIPYSKKKFIGVIVRKFRSCQNEKNIYLVNCLLTEFELTYSSNHLHWDSSQVISDLNTDSFTTELLSCLTHAKKY